MVTALLVAAGGAAGSLARYLLAGAINTSGHPWGTATVNIIGSFILGILIGLWGFTPDSAQRIAIGVGVLGGFTTFSTFAVDTLRLWETDRVATAIAYVLLSVIVGILAAFIGIALGRRFA